MQGKIIKGISGFYYVNVVGSGIYECKAKGIFRNRKMKPLVGDVVEIDILDEMDKEGNITEICPRKNELIRPAVANIDQALLIFASDKPAPNFNLLDRFLVTMGYQGIPAVICFNKSDLLEGTKRDDIYSAYQGCGYPVIFTSAKEGTGIEELSALLRGKTSTVAGSSGVGKSSIVNLLQNEVEMETGDISHKIGRGKNTTRHSMLIHMEGNTYIMDTPGFGSLDVLGISAEELWRHYREFLPYEPSCRFQGCSHIHEPDCGVKQALWDGNIHPMRYENYVSLYRELKERNGSGRSVHSLR